MTDRTELRRLLDEATPGPWALYDGWLHEGRAHVARIGNAAGNGIGAPATDMAGEIADFELIAAAVNALPGLLDQLDAAEAALARYPNPLCECGKDYPCPTIRALDATTGGES